LRLSIEKSVVVSSSEAGSQKKRQVLQKKRNQKKKHRKAKPLIGKKPSVGWHREREGGFIKDPVDRTLLDKTRLLTPEMGQHGEVKDLRQTEGKG